MTHEEALELGRSAVARCEAAGIRPRLSGWLLEAMDPRPVIRRRRYRPGRDLPCCYGTALEDSADACTCRPQDPPPQPMTTGGA